MVGLTPIAALVGIFVWLGLSAPRFDGRTKRYLFVLIVVVIALDLVGAFGSP